jgi:uncharacterized Tic20 family protein
MNTPYTTDPSLSSLPPLPTTQGDRILGVLCHLSFLLGITFFFFPLVVFVVRSEDSPWVSANAREVLNFHISLFVYALICIPFTFILIGIPMLIVLYLFGLLCSFLGAIRATEGVVYRYPATFRLL